MKGKLYDKVVETRYAQEKVALDGKSRRLKEEVAILKEEAGILKNENGALKAENEEFKAALGVAMVDISILKEELGAIRASLLQHVEHIDKILNP